MFLNRIKARRQNLSITCTILGVNLLLSLLRLSCNLRSVTTAHLSSHKMKLLQTTFPWEPVLIKNSLFYFTYLTVFLYFNTVTGNWLQRSFMSRILRSHNHLQICADLQGNWKATGCNKYMAKNTKRSRGRSQESCSLQ